MVRYCQNLDKARCRPRFPINIDGEDVAGDLLNGSGARMRDTS